MASNLLAMASSEASPKEGPLSFVNLRSPSLSPEVVHEATSFILLAIKTVREDGTIVGLPNRAKTVLEIKPGGNQGSSAKKLVAIHLLLSTLAVNCAIELAENHFLNSSVADCLPQMPSWSNDLSALSSVSSAAQAPQWVQRC